MLRSEVRDSLGVISSLPALTVLTSREETDLKIKKEGKKNRIGHIHLRIIEEDEQT